MQHNRVLKQAWQNVLHYRALWLFGIILALTTASLGTATLWGRDDDGQYSEGITITRMDDETFVEALERSVGAEIDQANQELDEFLAKLDFEAKSNVVTVLIWFGSISIAIAIISTIAKYVSETALIRMVDRQHESGQKQTVRQGFRLGWSRGTARLFLIELLVNLTVVTAGILLFALIFGPLPLWVTGSEMTIFTGAILTGGLFFLAIFLLILTGMAVSLLKLFARRACVLEGLGVTASIHRAFTLLKREFKQVLPMWLLTLGVNLSWPAVIGSFFVLLFGVGVLLGGLPALLIGDLTDLASAGELAKFLTVSIGAIILTLLLAAPLVWLDGMRQVFLSSLWTLTYREIRDLESVPQEDAPEMVLPDTPPLAQGASAG